MHTRRHAGSFGSSCAQGLSSSTRFSGLLDHRFQLGGKSTPLLDAPSGNRRLLLDAPSGIRRILDILLFALCVNSTKLPLQCAQFWPMLWLALHFLQQCVLAYMAVVRHSMAVLRSGTKSCGVRDMQFSTGEGGLTFLTKSLHPFKCLLFCKPCRLAIRLASQMTSDLCLA